MKRVAGFILALLMAASLVVALADDDAQGYTYYALVGEGVDGDGCLYVCPREDGVANFRLKLPEGSEAPETFFYNAVRYTLDMPLAEAYDGDESAIVPLSAERCGVITGRVVELGEDYIISYVYERAAERPDAPTIRLALPTDAYRMKEFESGDQITIIYDEETETVLELWTSNG